jgi:hypothetical protein
LALLDALLESLEPSLGIEAELFDLPAMIRRPIGVWSSEEVGNERGRNPLEWFPGGVNAQFDV